VLSERKPPQDVSVVTVTRSSVTASITTNGKIEPVTPYEMRALAPSYVTKIPAAEGQSVTKGQLLVNLDDTELRASIAQAQADFDKNRESLRVAEAGGSATELAKIDNDIKTDAIHHAQLQDDIAKLEKLVAQQAATQQELVVKRDDLAQTELDEARLQTTRADFVRNNSADIDRLTLAVQQSQENLDNLRNQLSSLHVVAPISGTLYSLPVHVNDPVKPGDLLAAIADLRRIRVRAYVDEPDLGGLAPGQAVTVTWDGLPNRSWVGRTGDVPREVVTHGTRTVGELLCNVNNDDQKLIPNTTVNVRIQLATHNGVVTIPRGAVIFDGSRRYVYVVDKSGAETVLHMREIHLGISDSTTDEVLSGLSVGETVALPSNFEPKEGMKVRVTNAE
jgi:HlyD family secretion protein